MHGNEHGWLWSPKFLTIAVPVSSGYRRTVAMLCCDADWHGTWWYLPDLFQPTPGEPHRCNHFVIDDPNLCGTVHWLDLGDRRHLPMGSKKLPKSRTKVIWAAHESHESPWNYNGGMLNEFAWHDMPFYFVYLCIIPVLQFKTIHFCCE